MLNEAWLWPVKRSATRQTWSTCTLRDRKSHNNFLYNKTNRYTNFPNLFWLKINLYMFRAVPLSIIRTSFTVHLALVYVIQVWRQLSSRAGIFHPGPARKLHGHMNVKITVSVGEFGFSRDPWKIRHVPVCWMYLELWTEKKRLGYLPRDFSARTFAFECFNRHHELVLHVKTERKFIVILRPEVSGFWV
jgi:hypothetical protein